MPWLVSARSDGGLREQAARLRDHVRDRPELSPADVGHALLASRTAFDHRAIVLADDHDGYLAGLDAVAEGRTAADVVEGVAREPGKPVFVFPGQGAQWAGMAADLYRDSAVFRDRLRACAAAVAPHVDFSLVDVVCGAEGAASLDRVDVVQPALWAMMVSLAELWRSYGVEPGAVVGHSQGEIAAACVAGALSLQDGARIVALRSRLVAERLAGSGGMAFLALPLDQAGERLAEWGARLSVAAANSPSSVVVSGDAEALDELLAAAEREGVRAIRVAVDYASHSAQVEPLEAELLAVLADIAPRPAEIPFHSTVTGGLLDTEGLDAAYWYRNLRRTVRFDPTVRALLTAGHRTYVEVSPHPVLAVSVHEILDGAAAEGTVLTSLRRGEGDARRVATSLAEAHVQGVRVDWSGRIGPRARLVDLPTHAFQRRRYWPDGALAAVQAREGDDSAAARFRQRLAELPESAGERLVLETVCEHAAAVLHRDPADLDATQAFTDLGFVSMTAMELRNRLATTTGVRVSPAAVFDHPTAERLAAHLRTLLTGSQEVAAAPVVTASVADEPVAIVAMGCRFPGDVASPEQLWDLVASGRDATSSFPANRGWDVTDLYDPTPGTPGRTYVRRGGFLHDADRFDPLLFGISPREALAMDPQQRLLLEVAWETFERAKLAPDAVRGSSTGVFVGLSGQDYLPLLTADPDESAGHLMTGTSTSVASGRLAYAFGLEGPAVTVDTACSSSLVALHLAVQALRQGDCTAALVAGVTVLSTPGAFVEFSAQGALAPDGRCKAFAAAADGTGWGEGVGVLLVEPLSKARREGHEVLAVIRGSAINQDGASNGLSAPNGLAQQRVIRQALAHAGLDPRDVDAVEAHGTGTTLGDPIEAEALLATYGQGRPARSPLWLGSLKSNIGHTAGAAGVGGVIKTVLALRQGVLPPTLHVDDPTRHVDWSSGAVELLTEARPWPDTGRARRAGVSSFGISGTNAHVILEQAPAEPLDPAAEPQPSEPPERSPLPAVPWPLSGKTEQAVRQQAARLRQFAAERPDLAPADVARSLAGTRAALEHRAVVIGEDRETLLAGLALIAEGGEDGEGGEGGESRQGGQDGQGGQGSSAPHVLRGAARARGRVALRLTGGDPAARTDPAYARLQVHAAALEEVAAACAAHPDEPVVTGALARFAADVALFRLLEHWGVTPDHLVGHGVGEVTAAHCAGALSLADAVALASALDGEADGVHRAAKELTFRPPVIPLVSGRTGGPVSYEELSAPEHWSRLARETGTPDEAPRWPDGQGAHEHLDPDRDGATVRALLTALARLHVGGAAVDWDTPLADAGARLVELPTYAFQRERYWPEATGSPLGGSRAGSGGGSARAERGREFRARLAAAAGPDERRELVTALVRAEVAAVLKLADAAAVADDRNLPELGFDSLTAVDLRNRLGAATGLRLPPALVFQHPTVTDVARFLADRWETSGPEGTADAAPEPGERFTLGPLLARAGELGRTEEFHELVRGVARFRPTFDAPDERLRPPRVRLARGSAGAGPDLVCFPTFAVGAGAPQYARLAAAADGEHDVWAQPVPGFSWQEPLPASVDALARLLADGVETRADAGPAVLLGYSAGGWIAHATAAVLEERGAGPAAVVLLDSHWPGSATIPRLHARIERARAAGSPDVLWTEEAGDDAYLTALAHYSQLFETWRPHAIGAPTLLVRAAEPAFDEPATGEPAIGEPATGEPDSGGAPDDWRPRWHLPHTAVDTAGTHFSIVREHSEPALRAVRDWLGGLH